MVNTTEKPYTEEDVRVADLIIDPRVQRQGLNMAKVKNIAANYNPGALGVISVSVRKDRSMVVIDGGHRSEATRIVTDNNGVLRAHVFRGLTLAEEAQMFLDLNQTTQPLVADKFNVLLSADSLAGEHARNIAELVGAYGFKVSNVPNNGNINCIQVVQRIYNLSINIEAQPNLLQVTVLVLSRAWGNDRFAFQAPIMEGIARMFAEYGSRLDLDHLIDVLKDYKGGPRTLSAEASGMAALMKGKKSMSVANILVSSYNRGRRSKTLEPWRKRT